MSEYKTVGIQSVKADPTQPRKIFDENSLLDLKLSIEERGQIQPIIVTKNNDGTFTIVDGERRLKAIENSEKINQIDIIIRDFTAEEVKATQLLSNWDRVDITLMEKANAIQSFIDDFTNGDKHLASKKLGKNIRTINKILNVYKSDPEVLKLIEDGYISDYSIVPQLNNLKNNNEEEFKQFVERLKHGNVENMRKELQNNPNAKKTKSPTKQKFSRHKPRAIVDIDMNSTKIDTPIIQISDKEDMYQFKLNTSQALKLHQLLNELYDNEQ